MYPSCNYLTILWFNVVSWNKFAFYCKLFIRKLIFVRNFPELVLFQRKDAKLIEDLAQTGAIEWSYRFAPVLSPFRY